MFNFGSTLIDSSLKQSINQKASQRPPGLRIKESENPHYP